MKWPLMTLAVALGLAPIVGGQLSVDLQPLAPGFGALVAAVLAGTPAPTLSAALVAVLALTAFVGVLATHRAVQAPAWTVALPTLLLLATLGASVVVSEFRMVSVQAWLVWLAYGVALVAAVAVAGRERGPKVLLGALIAGCAFVAFRGIAEYGQMRALDPTWRVFAGWVNQNALAGMLMLGLFPALAFTLVGPRLTRLVAASAVVVIGLALVLTQSRGGFVAGGIGIVTFLGLALAWCGWRSTAPAAMTLAVVLALAVGVQLSAQSHAPGAGGVLGRVAAGGTAEAQSAGFRRLLWRGALEMIRSQPSGVGIGAYRFSSAKSGLTVQTHFAHNTYLQLGAEASPLATVALVLVGAGWIVTAFRGARKMPPDRNVLRAGVVAAVVSCAAHNLVDSTLYHFGIGFACFAMLGLGLQLAADGSTPELMPRGLRSVGVALGGILGLTMLGFGVIEATKARVMGDAVGGDVPGVKAGLARLRAFAPTDGDTWVLHARLAPDAAQQEERMRFWREAVAHAPTTRALRALAREHAARGEFASAEFVLARVFVADPNNLPALEQRMRMRVEGGDVNAALEDARRMVEIEASPYVKARALPELVPRQPIEARLFLATQADEPRERATWLQGAVDGYARYAASTLPQVRMLTQGEPGLDWAGESWQDVVEAMTKAREAATELAKVYRALGDAGAASRAEELAATVFAEPSTSISASPPRR